MPERKADDINTERLCADAYMPNAHARTVRIDADAGSRYAEKTIATMDAHACLLLFWLLLLLLWSNRCRKERRHRAGVEYMFGSILKTSQK